MNFIPVALYTLLTWVIRLLSRFFGSLRNQIFAAKTYVVATFFIGFTQLITALTKKVFIALGVGYVTYTLGSFGLNQVYDMLQDQLHQLPGDALMFIKLARVDEAFSIVFGAISARMTLMGFSMLEARRGRVFYA